ncbi:MAG: ATP-binding cassette domain-containing protein [Thiobacillus sp.]|nr:ATP-binding cassette domain-containing protein [Thiobacillus sp.]
MLLETLELSLTLNGRAILRAINLRIAAREIHVLLGANGSGKSSLAWCLMGCGGYAPQAGEIRFDGDRIDHMPLHERARRGMALAWQEPARFEGLSVAQFLRAGAENADVVKALRAVGLAPDEYLSRSLDKTLSGGERKRIELAGMLTLQPRLAIFDEPTAGIDMLSLDDVMRVIETLRQNGSAVLLITHQETIAAQGDSASQLCGGRIVCQGKPDAVIANYKARSCRRCDGETCGYD